MTKLIKDIRNIIMPHEDANLKIEIFPDNSMTFLIYSTEIPIGVSIAGSRAVLQAELYDYDITTEMMVELTAIMKLIDSRIDDIIAMLKGV